LKYVYFAFAAVGIVTTWTYNILALQELGTGFTPTAFILIGFQGPPMLGSLAADFWVSAVVGLIWVLIEARRLKQRFWWIWVPLTVCGAWAFAFPLFLGFREHWLEQRST